MTGRLFTINSINKQLTYPTDYSVFAGEDFDPNEYANATLAGEPYPPSQQQPGSGAGKTTKTGLEPAKEDISVALSKLDFGIEDVSKQIKNVVCVDVLVQVAYLFTEVYV
jgi:conserved oligomeric Golgi complex subunit 5